MTKPEIINLGGGARIVAERLSFLRSAAFGIWVGSGSAYETEKLAGVSHAMEHMVFKGTKTRTAAQIAEKMDAIGGQLNAFTTKECTCFYGRALTSHLTEAIDLLCDIFFDAKIDEEDWRTERTVIIEEIGMYEDSPEDMVSERLFSNVFRGSTLAHPILGSRKTLNAMTCEDIKAWRRDTYKDLVISIAGAFDDCHLDYIKQRFETAEGGRQNTAALPVYKPGRVFKKKSVEQNHWCLAFEGLTLNHDDRHALMVLSGIIGGGMSSRLFQTIREREGLCYEISTFVAPHLRTGLWAVYTATGKDAEKTALPKIVDILKDVRDHGVTDDEVSRTREQLKASAIMGMESPQTRMTHTGQSALLGEGTPILTMDDILERFDAVDTARCRALAEKLIDFDKLAVSAVGRLDSKERYDEILLRADQ